MAATTLEELQKLIAVETRGLDKALDRFRSQLTAVHKQVDKTATGIGHSLKKIGTALNNSFSFTTMIDFGKAAQQSVGQVKSVLGGLQRALDGTTGAIGIVSDISTLCGSEGIGALGTALKIVAEDRAPQLTGSLTTLWTQLAAHPVLIAAAAIGALIAALVTAYATNDSFRAAVDDLAAKLATALAPALEFVQGVLQTVWSEVFVPFGDFLLWLWETVLLPLAGVLSDILGVALNAVADVAASLWNNVLVPLGDFLLTVFGAIVQGVADIFTFWWQNVLVPIAVFLSDIFGPIVEGISTVFTFLWKEVLLPLIEFLAGQFTAYFNEVTEVIGGIIDGLKTTFTGLIDFIVGVFTGDWEKAWEGVKAIFKGVFDSLWSIVKYPLNLIIDGVNMLIGGLNSISFDIPSWVPLLGGMSFGINIPKIPKLARGGIIDQPMIALLGERGREAVVPLENTGFIALLANAVASAVGTALLQVQQLGSGKGDTGHGRELAMYIDSRQIARAIIPAIDSERSRAGLAAVIKAT